MKTLYDDSIRKYGETSLTHIFPSPLQDGILPFGRGECILHTMFETRQRLISQIELDFTRNRHGVQLITALEFSPASARWLAITSQAGRLYCAAAEPLHV